MKNKLGFIAVIFAVMAAMVALTPDEPCASAKPASADMEKTVPAMNAFGVDFYGLVASDNLICSPYSIYSALGMVHAGARGDTEREMNKTMHIEQPSEVFHPALGAIYQDLNQRGDKKGMTLSVANKLWAREGMELLDDYTKLVKKNYGAGVEMADFSDPSKIVREINQWVEEQTNNKIKNLLKPDMIDQGTSLVLVNAVYFKGLWENQFKKEDTLEQDFFVDAEKTVKAPLMTQEATFGYYADDTVQLLEMPYKGGDFSMVLLLPAAKDGLAAFEKSLTARNLSDLVASAQPQKVKVFVPRFKFTSDINLKNQLPAMGITSAFTPGVADFSGINGGRDLYISAAVHKAFIEVNEEGTEAAAATAIVMGKMAMPMVTTFRADHPFMFLIRDRVTGTILFMGRVADPTK